MFNRFNLAAELELGKTYAENRRSYGHRQRNPETRKGMVHEGLPFEWRPDSVQPLASNQADSYTP